MVGYKPLYISGMSAGLTQSRQNFILPNDAYPVLNNAYVWRERILRKKGNQKIGRLSRLFSSVPIAVDSSGNGNIWTALGITPTTETILPGKVVIGYDSNIYTDPLAQGVLVGSPTGSGTINYITGDVHFPPNPFVVGGGISSIYICSNLPVTGILTREINSSNDSETIFFDTKYAYKYDIVNKLFIEYISGSGSVSWNGADHQLFWSTNYWVDGSNNKLFWVTNFNIDQATRNPIYYTNGSSWTIFAPNLDAGSTNFLQQALMLAPFRSRLLAFNTFEGAALNSGVQYRQRIRWAAIGSPLSANAWASDIPGKGGFLDIPTNQDIISIGFVRDNLVIYCERSTWQLRYTGRSIQPFQIERVNSEMGTEATFSSVQFDTSLATFGDKGIIECDSFKAERFDIKIPDLTFDVINDNYANERIYGIRDFQNKLVYWTYCVNDQDFTPTYPNKRLVYNYENDSWAIFDDSITALGSFQDRDEYTWANANFTWQSANFPWRAYPTLFPFISAGNQQGFIYKLDIQVVSDPTLYILNISSGTDGITVITSNNNNLATGKIVKLLNMGSDFSYLEGIIVWVERIDDNSFEIYQFSTETQDFDEPVAYQSGTYVGSGYIQVRDNFVIQSKKFNFLEDGQNIQLGFIDILLETTAQGAITMNVYNDYNDFNPVNTLPQNSNPSNNAADSFFNSIIPTYPVVNNGSTKNWQRIYCASRAAFITTEFTLSPAQMNDVQQESNVQIDAQVMWIRRAGRQLPIGA